MKEKIGIISVLLLSAAVYCLDSGKDVSSAPCFCAESVRRQVRLEISCLNKHDAPCRTSYRIPLLQTYLPQQKVEGLKIEPAPDRFETDGWQNRYAVYETRKIPAQKEFKVVQRAVITGYAPAFFLSFHAKAVPADPVFALRIKASKQEEQTLRRLADSIAGQFSHPLFKAVAVYDYIRKNFSFEISRNSRNFTQMLEEKRLQCADAALLNSKLLQLSGIKAGTANGFIVYNEKDNSAAAHSWSEFYLEKCGFVPADPTQGRYPYTRQLFFGKYAPEIILWYRGEDGGCQMNEYDFPDAASASPVLKMNVEAPARRGGPAGFPYAAEFSLPEPVFADAPPTSLPFSCSLDKLTGFSSAQALRFVKYYPCLTEAAEPLSRLSWVQADLQSLNELGAPLAVLTKAWMAIYSQSWEEAEDLLGGSSHDQSFEEARLTEALLTFQYQKAAQSLCELSGCPLSPLAAETCLQLCQDLRLWSKQLAWADYFCRLYPGEPSFILKGYAAAFKSGQEEAQNKYLQLWQSHYPRDGYIYLQAGQLFLEKDDYRHSLEMFGKALTLDLAPEEREFCQNLTASLEKSSVSETK
ncbi:transglutaminase family protein [bacterium]|nr:transglutaminase family protein [bacterium]